MLPAALRLLVIGWSTLGGMFPASAADLPVRSVPTRPTAPSSVPAPPVAAAVTPKATAAPVQRAVSTPRVKLPSPELRSTAKSPAASPAPATLVYIGAKEMARTLNLTPKWDPATRQLTLLDAQVTLVLERDQRETDLNGMRVFLGAPTVWRNGELAVSQIDFQRLLLPAIRPLNLSGPTPGLKVIAIDPGHGGRDTGKVNAGQKVLEKEATLDTARRLKLLLEAQGFTVVLTRSDDRFVELAERPEIATRESADLFISLHFNAVEAEATRVTGVEVYTMTPQFQLSADRRLDDHVPVFNPGNAMDPWNTVLGYHLHRALLSSLKVPDRGLKRGRYVVLRLARCPAVLIEAGFLSHDGEARRIATPQYRQEIAAAIAAGVHNYVTTVAAVRAQQAGLRKAAKK